MQVGDEIDESLKVVSIIGNKYTLIYHVEVTTPRSGRQLDSESVSNLREEYVNRAPDHEAGHHLFR